jgi:hypothetical protein
LHYESLGFDIEVQSDNGASRFSFFGVRELGMCARDFNGKTDKGVGLGSTSDEVIEAYGKPEFSAVNRNSRSFEYFHQGLSFQFWDNKLSRFSISSPRSDQIEFIDNGNGSYTERVKGNK